MLGIKFLKGRRERRMERVWGARESGGKGKRVKRRTEENWERKGNGGEGSDN